MINMNIFLGITIAVSAESCLLILAARVHLSRAMASMRADLKALQATVDAIPAPTVPARPYWDRDKRVVVRSK